VSHDQGHTGKELYGRFSMWVMENGTAGMGKGKFLQRLRTMPGVVEIRLGGEGSGIRGFNVRERGDDDPGSANSANSATDSETLKRSDSVTGEVTTTEVSQKTADSAEFAGEPSAPAGPEALFDSPTVPDEFKVVDGYKCPSCGSGGPDNETDMRSIKHFGGCERVRQAERRRRGVRT
jgi:hypothetical protein